MYYYGARFYDPHLGRFVNQDPLGFGANDANLYRYVGNRPTTDTDPTGEMSLTEYAENLGKGPIGTIIANATFNCVMGQLFFFSVGQVIAEEFLGKQGITKHDAISLGIGITGCAVFGISAYAQYAFLVIAESIHMSFQLRDGSANSLDVLLMILSHAGGLGGGALKGGSGLLEHSASVRAFLADESGALRIPMPSSGASKSAKEMAEDLANELNKNRVSIRTGGKQSDIDLRGKAHFDKPSGTTVDTPHVHEAKINTGPKGETNLSNKTTREATTQDIRIARKAAGL